jgi:hypothetical protein
MEAPAKIPAAATRDELIRGHQELHGNLAAGMAELDPAVFFAPQGQFWSPAQHLDHLVRSVSPLAQALGLPRLALRLLFGRAEGSRRLDEVVGVYLGKLEAGGGADGKYLPAPVADSSRAAQQKLVFRWLKTGQSLDQALAGWSDLDLDRYRLPHPLIGKLTVREMVAWSLYHGYHHWARMAERSGGRIPGPERISG